MKKPTFDQLVQALDILAALDNGVDGLDTAKFIKRHPKIAAQFKDQHPDKELLDLNYMGLKAVRILRTLKDQSATKGKLS